MRKYYMFNVIFTFFHKSWFYFFKRKFVKSNQYYEQIQY